MDRAFTDCEANHRLPRILIVTGGPGPEHTASIESALGILEQSESLKAQVQFHVCVITRDELWLDEPRSHQYLRHYSTEGENNLCELGGLADSHLHSHTPWEALANADAVFPVIHGALGEDGVLLGLSRALGKPFIGCDILCSVICLDKAVCNALLKDAGIPQTPSQVILCGDDIGTATDKLTRRGLNLPWVVKPANGGCSIGISMLRNASGLQNALTKSREQFPHSASVVETAVENMFELDVAVLEQDGEIEIITTSCGLRRSCHSEQRPQLRCDSPLYTEEIHQHGNVPDWAVPAPDIPQAAEKKMQDLAIQVFKVVRASTWLRVDFFFVPSTGQILVNEINTMPSLASGAMLFKLWAAAGISPSELILRVVSHSLKRQLGWNLSKHAATRT